MRNGLLMIAGVVAAVLPWGSPEARADDPAPTIATITPNTGTTLGNTLVTITGTNFRSPLEVSFGGATGENLNIVNSSLLTVRTPAGALVGPANVVITHVGTTRTDSAPSVGGFTFTAPPCHVWVPRDLGSATGGNDGGFDITIVDAANRSVVTSLNLNDGDASLPNDDDWRPTQVLFDSTGAWAYIGSRGTPGSFDSNKIWIVDTAAALGQTEDPVIVGTIDVGGNPISLALSALGTVLYVADAGSWSASAVLLPNGRLRGYDLTDRSNPVATTASPAITGILPVMSYSLDSQQGWGTNSSTVGTVQSKTGRCVIANSATLTGSATLTVVDLSSLTVVDTVDVSVNDGGLVQIVTAIPSPFNDDFVYVQTNDPTSGATEYFIYRITTGDLIRKGNVGVPVLMVPVQPFPDVTSRIAWPHPDNESLVAVPTTEASVAAWSPATGIARNRTAVQGGGPPQGLAYNDATGFFYAREADGGWTVLTVPDTTTGGAAPEIVTTVADATGLASLRVYGDGTELAATGTSVLAIIEGNGSAKVPHAVKATVPLPLDPNGGSLFPQPGLGCGNARTFAETQGSGGSGNGPVIELPLPGSEYCSGDAPAEFEFSGGGVARSYELELGTQPDFIVGPGARRVRIRVSGTSDVVIPSAGDWRQLLRAAAGDVVRPFYARVNSFDRGGGFTFGDTTSFKVCPPEPCEAVEPEDLDSADPDSAPEFTFTGDGHVRAWIEFAGEGGFEDGIIGRHRVREDVGEGEVTTRPSDRLWRRVVKKARKKAGTSGDVNVTWRVRCRDDFRRKVYSDEMTLDVTDD